VTKHVDISKDPLAAAALSPDERQVWETVRSELGGARSKIEDLETRVRLLERQPTEEDHSILTRPEFNREVARMLAFDERYGGVSSVLYFDFEHLEDVSAQFGKSVANAAIRQIGDLLIQQVRGSDVVGRLAPDEFGVLLMRCDNESAWSKGEDLARKLYECLAQVHGVQLPIIISYGAYTFKGSEDVAAGLKEAAHALTRARPLL
jgi:diguanylate cyclase (GGDEF)-like protein